ncbi:MAG: hypothetical protein ACYCW6_20115 [Candidatus Xenobia bacterium]
MTDPMPIQDRRHLLGGVIRIMAEADTSASQPTHPPVSRIAALLRRLSRR